MRCVHGRPCAESFLFNDDVARNMYATPTWILVFYSGIGVAVTWAMEKWFREVGRQATRRKSTYSSDPRLERRLWLFWNILRTEARFAF